MTKARIITLPFFVVVPQDKDGRHVCQTSLNLLIQVAYAEAGPILIISEASLEDLNSRLEKKVAITNFRPNILVTGCGPYEEVSFLGLFYYICCISSSE